MKEHIVMAGDGHSDDLDKLKNLNDTKESVQVLTDSFIAVAEKMKELADALRDESIDIYDPMADKRRKEKTFKENVANLKHVKKRGKY